MRATRVFTQTTTKLIEDLRDPANTEAWEGFDARYRPVLLAFARRLGFSPEDASDIAQQTLVEFVRCHREGRYIREQGRLSSWIIGIARNVASAARRTRAAARAGDGSALAELPEESRLAEVWEDERRRAILEQALSILRTTSRADANTLLAFELFALRSVPAEEVATRCSMSVDSVYVAKNRMTRRLRDIVEQITGAYSEDGE
ncbi:MAG: sigma-70 family RNA polymerase sigma factor [Phycisphaerales bacterium]|nr:sigma-70 family RNA polymerase sigma factor [Phycisphaerales bacterium]